MSGKEYKRVSAEVLYTTETLPVVGQADVDFLKEEAKKNPRERSRICVHPDASDELHEMFIIHKKGCYVRPHRHNTKAESIMVIEGEVDLFCFDEAGNITQVIELGAYGGTRPFFYRMQKPTYHSLLIQSKELVFLETSRGPFSADSSAFPDWAPTNDDIEGQKKFMAKMEAKSRTAR